MPPASTPKQGQDPPTLDHYHVLPALVHDYFIVFTTSIGDLFIYNFSSLTRL